MRIDDLDTPRNMKDGAELILATLENFGLEWDENVYYQSRHRQDYEHHLAVLESRNRLYRCICSRKTLAPFGDFYPNFCRNRGAPFAEPCSRRILTEPGIIEWHDVLHGRCREAGDAHGDFVVKRKDGIVAYQFAVVVDDYLQGVTHVVRGFDLMAATARQIYLHRQLNLPIPRYCHVPVIVDADGCKLSKQTLAAPIEQKNPQAGLLRLLRLLRQNPPPELVQASLSETLAWAVAHWNMEALKNVRFVPETCLVQAPF